VIRLDDVHLALGGSEILKGVSLGLDENETGVILGASGSGKTTILRLILGLYRPDSGHVLINGYDIAETDDGSLYKVREKMGMVFQGGALFDSLTVGENVGYRLIEQRALGMDEIEGRVRKSLCFVGLEDAIDMMPAELSGGMKKRVAIARGIVASPKIMLYDEPTTGLDPVNAYNINTLINKLRAEEGVTSVVVTHDIPSAFTVATKIAFIHEGRILYTGGKEGLFESGDVNIKKFLRHSGGLSGMPANIGNGCSFNDNNTSTGG